MDEFKKIELFPENQTRKKWKEDFVCAIKNKNLVEVEKLIDESNAFYYDEFIHHAYIDDNFKFHFDTNVIANILKKSKDNTIEIVKYIWSIGSFDNLPEKFIYEAETIKNFLKPIALPMLCPFVVTGVYVFGLFFKFHFCDEYLIRTDKKSNLIKNSDVYGAIYRKNARCGKNAQYSLYKNLESKLHLNLSVYDKGQKSDFWKFCEMIQYVDSIFKSDNAKLLLHIIEDLRDYVAFDNEIFLNKNNPNIIKIILFRSIVFQQLNDEEQEKMIALVLAMRQISLESKRIYYRETMDEFSKMNWLEKYSEYIPYMHPTVKYLLELVAKLKDKGEHSFEDRLSAINKIIFAIREMQNQQFIQEFKNKKKDTIFVAVLLKLIIYEQKCRFSAKIVNEKFLQSPLQNKKLFFETTQKVMEIDEPVGENDWKKYFNKYAEELKIIFPSMPEKEIKIKWQAACRLSLFLDAQKMNFEFEQNRLRTFSDANKKTNSKKKSSKKIDSESFTDGRFSFADLVVLMDILKIGETVDLNDYVGIKRFKRPFLKSKTENDEKEGEKFLRRTIKNIFDGIARYSTDLVMVHLKQLFYLRTLLYLTSNETLLEKINLWNQKQLLMFELMFKSEDTFFQFVYAICLLWNDYIIDVKLQDSQKIFENEEDFLAISNNMLDKEKLSRVLVFET